MSAPTWLRRVLLATLAVIVVVAAIFLIVHRQHVAATARAAAAPQPVSVGVSTVGVGDVQESVAALGAVTPLATVTVKTQISGRLMRVGFREGQIASEGSFLAQIDERPYVAAHEQAEATLARDQALLAGARVDLERYTSLLPSRSIPQQQYDDQKALVHQDEATVRLDEALVKSAALNVAYCRIVAPVTGKVGLRIVDPGNFVQPSDTTGIVVMTQLDPIAVVFPVAEDHLQAILERMATGVVLTATAWDRTGKVQLAKGALAAVDSEIDPTTGTVKLKAHFDNKDGKLFPSQFVNVVLVVSILSHATTVAIAAVQHGAPGDFVYLVSPGNVVAAKPVKLGPTQGQVVAVTEGLAPGDIVVVDGADRLKDGASVQIAKANPSDGT